MLFQVTICFLPNRQASNRERIGNLLTAECLRSHEQLMSRSLILSTETLSTDHADSNSRTSSHSRTGSVSGSAGWPVRMARTWCKRGSHVPRDVFSRSCQLGLDGSAWQSQNLGRLKNREPHQHAQLKCSPQGRRQPYRASLQACTELQISALILGAGSRVREVFPKEVFFVFSHRLIQRQISLAGPFAQLHQRTVANNRGQPCSHLRLPPKLAYVTVSGQQSFLYRIFGVGCVAQKSHSAAIKRWQARCQNFLHLDNRTLAGGHHVRITLAGLSFHFQCRFASHDQQNARRLPKGRPRGESRFKPHADDVPRFTRRFVNHGEIRGFSSSGSYSIKLTRY
jgi:hypothetical protein